MASKKSAEYPNQWPDGSWHSIPYTRELQRQGASDPNAPNLGQITGASPLNVPPPPPGSYDPAIDYQGGAAQRGYDQTRDDAATQYERGQQTYGVDLGDLTRGRDRNLQDIGTNRTRENEDYGTRTSDLAKQFSILGHQQAQSAAKQGITSAGLLGKSQSVRAANQAHDQTAIDTGHNRTLADLLTGETRTNEDFTSGKTRLDLGNAYNFGGYGGNTILNPLTGAPEIGTLTTNLARSGVENQAYQGGLGQQKIYAAQQGGYIAPVLQKYKALFNG